MIEETSIVFGRFPMMSCMVLPQSIPLREEPDELREVQGHVEESGAVDPIRKMEECLSPQQNFGGVRVHGK